MTNFGHISFSSLYTCFFFRLLCLICNLFYFWRCFEFLKFWKRLEDPKGYVYGVSWCLLRVCVFFQILIRMWAFCQHCNIISCFAIATFCLCHSVGYSIDVKIPKIETKSAQKNGNQTNEKNKEFEGCWLLCYNSRYVTTARANYPLWMHW